MVYRGKPSAGCENCRKAKKRCGLEQPSCSRCVKLKKVCSGYRDTTALQIQDESESVKRKADIKNARTISPLPSLPTPRSTSPPQQLRATTTSNHLAPPKPADPLAGAPTPGSLNSDSTSSSDGTIELERDMRENVYLTHEYLDFAAYDSTDDHDSPPKSLIPLQIKLPPDHIATTYFFNQFTAEGHWTFIRKLASERKLDPCLELTIKACGMAALGNVENRPAGRDYARLMYTSALGLINEALRDPKRSKTDESLISVAMLGRYENLACEGQASIQSWKAHIKGSTQLLKVRGKAQFRTHIGRILFREVRSQAMINAIWEDDYMPAFFQEYQEELDTYPKDEISIPVDKLTHIVFDFANLRADIRTRALSHSQALQEASRIESRFIQWSIDTAESSEKWRYYDMYVNESEHVWEGKIHAYTCLPAPTVWNMYRNMRIMLSRSQEFLCRQMQFTAEERTEQTQYFARTRRQLTDEICATIPVTLGHGSPAFSSPCLLITAYHSIWPLFFAGTCAADRVGPSASLMSQWIMGRLQYISQKIGLKWADGVVSMLRGELRIPQHLIQEDDRRLVPRFSAAHRAPWVEKVQESLQGGAFDMELTPF